jgi:uncharacterized protein YkwD
VALAAVLGACSAPGPRLIGAQPSWRAAEHTSPASPPEVTAITLAPTDPAVGRYAELEPPPPATPLGDAVTAEVQAAATRLGVHVPVPDARLFRACRELAAVVPLHGAVGYRLIEFAFQRHGVVEPSPHLLVAWGPLEPPSGIAAQLRPQLDDILRDGATARLGVGEAQRSPDGTGVVVFALLGSAVTLQPIPRAVPVGGTVAIDAVIDPRYHDPEVLVTRSDGATEVSALAAGQRPGAVVARVGCGGAPGKLQIEIAASDAAGAAVLANFPLWCGVAPPTAITLDERDDAPPASPADAEARLFASLNRARGAARLPALAWDDAVAAVARRYAYEMLRTQLVAHVSPTSGSASDRLRVAGIRSGVVLENIARAYGVGEAHDGLMNSPGHRANLLSATATHVGIGVAFGGEEAGRRELFIAQVFIRVPPELDAARALAASQRKILAARPGSVASTVLAAAAQHAATALASGQPRDRAFAAVPTELSAAPTHYQRVRIVSDAVADLDALDGGSLVAGADGNEFGVGVAQGPHPELGARTIWLVVLFATR